MILPARFTPTDSSPKTRELPIQLPKIKGDCVTILLDIFTNDWDKIGELTELNSETFTIGFGRMGDLMTEQHFQVEQSFEAAFNTEKKYFLYARLENQVVIHTLRLNLFEPVSIDFLTQYKNSKFIISITNNDEV